MTCIKLAPVVYAPLSTLRIVAQRTLAIVADDGQATLDGRGRVQLITAAQGADVTLANLRLSNGNVTFVESSGGAIYNSGTMKVLTCTFDHNFADCGGALGSGGVSGVAEIQACIFDRNVARNMGGALCSLYGAIKIQSCAFDNNHAERDGGAVVTFGGTMEMHGCNITNCSAKVLPLPRSATSLR